MYRVLPLALACALAACGGEPPSRAAAPAPAAKPATPPADADATQSGTRLTIYSGDYDALRNAVPAPSMPGFALLERPLHFALTAGPNTLSVGGIPASIDVEAATLRARTPGVAIESQRYLAPPAGASEVLARLLGQRVTVEHTAGGAKQTDAGTLLAAGDGLTLALPDGRIKVIREFDSFNAVDGARLVPTRAELQWTVRADRAGDADFALAYPMGGLAWRAEYLATLAGDAGGGATGCSLALQGAALVANRSGVGFNDTRLTLVAGEPNRTRAPRPMYAARAADMAAAAPAPPQQRRSGEYHAYDLPAPVRLASGTVERVPLFAPLPQVACERLYVVDAGGPEWGGGQPMLDPGYRGRTGTLPVVATIGIANRADTGLGRALPAGRVRIFDGGDLLGESLLDHTADGAELELQAGTAFDLGAEREATDFRIDRTGRTASESFRVTLRNAKGSDASVRVVEAMPRWNQWEVVASSVPARKRDASHAEFDVPVPAGGETVLTYTVRYRWNPGAMP